MLFITYQSKEVADILRSGTDFKLNVEEAVKNANVNNYLYKRYISFVEDTVGFNPIYCIPMEDIKDTLARSLYCFKSKPETAIIFESIDYDLINYVELIRGMQNLKIGKATNKNIRASELDKNFIKEYAVPEIKAAQVVKIIDIDNSDNSDNESNTEIIKFIDSGRLEDSIKELIKTDYSLAGFLERVNDTQYGLKLLSLMQECGIGSESNAISKDRLKKLVDFIKEDVIIEKAE